jgi:hypothetical protein
MVKKASKASRNQADSIAIAALTFIATDPERLGRFLASTGIGPGDIRIAAREPLFLAGVIGHIASDQELLLAFAAEIGLKPAEIDRARQTLAGPDWEREAP